MNKNIFHNDDWSVCSPGFLNGTGKCFRQALWRKVLATEYKLVITLKKFIWYQQRNHIYTTSQTFMVGWKLLWWLSSNPLIFKQKDKIWAFPSGTSEKMLPAQHRRHKRHGFDCWVWKTIWRRAWKPTMVFLPGESHGQRSLASYGPYIAKELDMTEAT